MTLFSRQVIAVVIITLLNSGCGHRQETFAPIASANLESCEVFAVSVDFNGEWSFGIRVSGKEYWCVFIVDEDVLREGGVQLDPGIPFYYCAIDVIVEDKNEPSGRRTVFHGEADCDLWKKVVAILRGCSNSDARRIVEKIKTKRHS